MTRAPGPKNDEATTDTPVWWCTQCEAVEGVEGTDTLDDLSTDERRELDAALDAGIADMRAGRVVDGAAVISRLLARNT
jgi:hypothetical protein